MTWPDTDDRYIVPASIDDGLGTGVRLHTSEDEVYEAREVDGAAVRVYGQNEDWGVLLNIPRTGMREGYDTFDTVAERLENAYDEDLITPSATFLDSVKAKGGISVDSGPITLQYRSEDGADADEDELELPGPEEAVPGYAVVGAGTGAAAGATTFGSAGPEAALLGAALGGVGGAFGGALSAFNEPALHPYSPIGTLQKANRRLQAYRDRRRTDFGRLGESELWQEFNEKRRLDAVQETARDMETTLRYDELRDDGVEEDVERLMDHHFQDIAKRPGVTVRFTGDRYTEAIELVANALDTEIPAVERPSIYMDAAVFRTLFKQVNETEQERLVDVAFEQDAFDQKVATYLENQHEDLVADVGQERSLNGDAR